MSVKRIASRYAKSLMELAIEQKELDTVLQDVKLFEKSLESRELYLLLKSPIIKSGKKQDIFNLVFKGKFSELTMAFFSIILKKGREEYLPEITDEFIQQYKDYKGITTVHLTTASELDKKTLENIKSELLESPVSRQEIELVHEIDNKLIGGFVIEVEDNLYDASVAHKLEEFKKSLLENKYVASR